MAITKFNNRPCSLSSVSLKMSTSNVIVKLDTILPINELTVDSDQITVDSDIITVDQTEN